jgi:transcription elongation factor GreA
MPIGKQAISAEGRAKAEAELEHLRNVRRAEIVDAIRVAREFGDLSENAEYHAAREAQSLNESRIQTLEAQLAHAEVIESGGDGSVAVGSQVSYRDAGADKLVEVTVVHPLEASVPEGRISADSPVGKALLGSREGDRVSFETPRGEKQLEVLTVA